MGALPQGLEVGVAAGNNAGRARLLGERVIEGHHFFQAPLLLRLVPPALAVPNEEHLWAHGLRWAGRQR